MRTSGDKKERLPIKNDEESSLVAEGGLFHDPLGGVNKEKTSHAAAWLRHFLFPFLHSASGCRTKNKKAGYFVPGFFFVAEGGFEPPTFGL